MAVDVNFTVKNVIQSKDGIDKYSKIEQHIRKEYYVWNPSICTC